MFQKLETCHIIISNMRRYGQQCQTFLLFVYSSGFLSHIHFGSLSISFISFFLSWSEFFSLADLAEVANLAANLVTDLAEAIVVLHNSLPLSSSSRLKPISPKATLSRWNWSCLKLPEADLAAWATGLFDLGWVLRFVNVLGCGLVVAVVLWLRWQFGGCGGGFFFWVVVDFFFF